MAATSSTHKDADRSNQLVCTSAPISDIWAGPKSKNPWLSDRGPQIRADDFPTPHGVRTSYESYASAFRLAPRLVNGGSGVEQTAASRSAIAAIAGSRSTIVYAAHRLIRAPAEGTRILISLPDNQFSACGGRKSLLQLETQDLSGS
jgi:hypothetical protein